LILPPKKDDSCVLWYDFTSVKNNTVYDQSKYHNDGTVYGAQHIGRFGLHGLHFDCVDDYVDCGNDASLQSIKTVIVLFYAQAQEKRFATIVAKAGWTGTNIQGWIMRYIGADFVFQAGDGTSARTAKISDLAEGIHLAAGVINDDDNQIRLYIDGELKNTSELYFSERDINLTLGYSAGLNAPDSHYKGNIYFITLYNRALSDAEIRELYYYLTKGIRSIIPSRFVARKVA